MSIRKKKTMISNKKNNGLANNIFSLVFLTAILKGIGFINKIIIAFYFGTTINTDVFYIAAGFVDSISAVLIASLTVGIINIYIGNKDKEGNDTFISSVLLLMILIMILFAGVLCVFTKYIAFFLAPSYSIEIRTNLVCFMKLMAITFPFQGIIAVLSALLQAEKRFVPVKMMGTITSVVSIVCVVGLSKRLGVNSLVLSYVVSVIVNALLLIRCSNKLYNFKFSLFKINPDIKKLFRLMLPLFIGTAAHEVNLMVDKTVASGVVVGAISALAFSSVLYLFIENIIINSIITALFPEITENIAQNNEKKAVDNLHHVIFLAEAVLIPITIISVIFAEDIVKLVYMRGSFDETSLVLTSYALVGYVIGLPMLFLRDSCMYTFYAYGNTKLPVYVNIVAVLINIILDFLLSRWLGVLGISLATAVSIMLSGVVLGVVLKKNKTQYFDNEFCGEMVKLVFSNICIMALALLLSKIIKLKFSFILVAFAAVVAEIGLLIVFKSLYIKNIKLLFGKAINR